MKSIFDQPAARPLPYSQYEAIRGAILVYEYTLIAAGVRCARFLELHTLHTWIFQPTIMLFGV